MDSRFEGRKSIDLREKACRQGALARTHPRVGTPAEKSAPIVSSSIDSVPGGRLSASVDAISLGFRYDFVADGKSTLESRKFRCRNSFVVACVDRSIHRVGLTSRSTLNQDQSVPNLSIRLSLATKCGQRGLYDQSSRSFDRSDAILRKFSGLDGVQEVEGRRRGRRWSWKRIAGGDLAEI